MKKVTIVEHRKGPDGSTFYKTSLGKWIHTRDLQPAERASAVEYLADVMDAEEYERTKLVLLPRLIN